MDDFTTSLTARLNLAVKSIVDDIAQEGLIALKSVLDDAGFGEYESLKNYQVFAHVSGGEITFEIQVEFDSLDEETKQKLPKTEESDSEELRRTARTYALSGVGGTTQRISGERDGRRPARDARSRIHDARRPAREVGDARRDASGRAVGHEFALRAPRGISITKQGKLSVALVRTVEKTDRGIRMPQGDFQGLVGRFMKKLQKIVAKNFVPSLEKILLRETQ